MAAFKGIKNSPRVRPLPERARVAHQTHMALPSPSHPAQIQVDGDVWFGSPSPNDQLIPAAGGVCEGVSRDLYDK